MADDTLPLEMRHLLDIFRDKAKRELNETSEGRSDGLKKLREMAKEHEVTRDVDFADDFLVQFLRHRKFDVDRAFRQLANFANFRRQHEDLFLGVDPYPDRPYFAVMPRRCPDGCAVIIVHLGKWEPVEVPFLQFEQLLVMLISQLLRDPCSQICGFKFIHDFEGFSLLKHGRYFTPANIALLYHSSMNCFPGRYKEVHMVSDNYGMRAVWAIAKTIISKKLKKRMFLHSSSEGLLRHFPRSVLPVEYGGLMAEEDYSAASDYWARAANERHKSFGPWGQDNYY